MQLLIGTKGQPPGKSNCVRLEQPVLFYCFETVWIYRETCDETSDETSDVTSDVLT